MSSVQLDDLPTEIFEQITQYLSLKECVRLERVNSKWRNAMRKEWRRLKIVDFGYYLLFSGMIDILNEKNNEISITRYVDLVTVCLQELAVKIHKYVQKIIISVGFKNGYVVAFLKKLSELSAPQLRELDLGRRCEIDFESDAEPETMADVAQSIPLTLESLRLKFWLDNSYTLKYFWDGLSQRTFTQLKSLWLCTDCSGDSSFRMNVLQIPNLKELTLVVIRCTNENVFDISNIDQLTYLETLRLIPDIDDEYRYGYVQERGFCKTLEPFTSKDCKFLQTLKTLDLYGFYNDEQLLSNIGRFSALERLRLPWMKQIDTADQLRILRSIDRGCATLKSLGFSSSVYFKDEIQDKVLIEVADGFHKLCELYLENSSVQQIENFVNSLSVDSCFEV